MLVDDLHTVDDGSQSVLAALARAEQGTPLWAMQDHKDVPVAVVLALGFERGKPQLPENQVLLVIASHLEESSLGADTQTTVAGGPAPRSMST